MLELCETEELAALCVHRLSQSGEGLNWPTRLLETLSNVARVQAGEELLRGAETRTVVDAMARAGLSPILIKGTPLAYTVYDAPSLRPREDTDLLIAPDDVDAARRVMASLGYSATVYCHDLFSQFEMQKIDGFGVCHVLDVHWKISTQPVFENVLTHSEMLSRAKPVTALGPLALTAGAVDSLLLACIHPAMHHQKAERMLWTYDTHLLASEMATDDWDDFVGRATKTQIAAVCAHELRRAQALFGTSVPADVTRDLSAAANEPSAAYLESHRTWRHELASSLGALPRIRDRVRLLRDVLLPSPDYMLGKYGLRGKPLGPWLLPVLYVHRNARGAWKVLAGKK